MSEPAYSPAWALFSLIAHAAVDELAVIIVVFAPLTIARRRRH